MPGEAMLEMLERYEYSFLAMAALYWKILVSNITEMGASLPEGDFLVIRYEDLVADPHKEARRAIEFVGLEAGDRRFEEHLRTVRIVDANQHRMRIPPWRESVSEKHLKMFEDVAGDELAQFGYV